MGILNYNVVKLILGAVCKYFRFLWRVRNGPEVDSCFCFRLKVGRTVFELYLFIFIGSWGKPGLRVVNYKVVRLVIGEGCKCFRFLWSVGSRPEVDLCTYFPFEDCAKVFELYRVLFIRGWRKAGLRNVNYKVARLALAIWSVDILFLWRVRSGEEVNLCECFRLKVCPTVFEPYRFIFMVG